MKTLFYHKNWDEFPRHYRVPKDGARAYQIPEVLPKWLYHRYLGSNPRRSWVLLPYLWGFGEISTYKYIPEKKVPVGFCIRQAIVTRGGSYNIEFLLGELDIYLSHLNREE